jgi:hypothetical protein
MSGLISAVLTFLVIAVVAIVVTIGGMRLYVKTKKPTELPTSMKRPGGMDSDESGNGR